MLFKCWIITPHFAAGLFFWEWLMLFLPWENWVHFREFSWGWNIMQRGISTKRFFYFFEGQVEHLLMEQREESWLLHLSGVRSVGYFPPSFLHFFSISGTKLIKIMCSKIIFGLRLTNWYKFQSDSDRSFHFAKSAKRGVRVCVCWEVCRTRPVNTTSNVTVGTDELARKRCVFSNSIQDEQTFWFMSQSVNHKFFHVLYDPWANAPPRFPTWESL